MDSLISRSRPLRASRTVTTSSNQTQPPSSASTTQTAPSSIRTTVRQSPAVSIRFGAFRYDSIPPVASTIAGSNESNFRPAEGRPEPTTSSLSGRLSHLYSSLNSLSSASRSLITEGSEGAVRLGQEDRGSSSSRSVNSDGLDNARNLGSRTADLINLHNIRDCRVRLERDLSESTRRLLNHSGQLNGSDRTGRIERDRVSRRQDTWVCWSLFCNGKSSLDFWARMDLHVLLTILRYHEFSILFGCLCSQSQIYEIRCTKHDN